jgi:hypothetical protein
MQYDLIAFKSCFPNSNIADDYQLSEFKSYYVAIRDRIDQYPDKLFVVVTQPPQVPNETNAQEGERARALANWLQSDEYLSGHPNIFVFDFFGHLAGDDNFLRPEYRMDAYDAHPNERANREIGPLFVSFLDEAIRSFQGGAPRPTPTPEGQAAPTPTILPTPTPAQGTQPSTPTEGVIDDFESSIDHWHCSSDDRGASSATFEADTSVFRGGAASFSLHYDVAPNSSGSCGQSYEAHQDWSSGTGLSLWMRTDEAGLRVTVMLFAGDPGDPTPFEAHVEPTTEWREYVIPWADTERAAWASAGGLSALDPAQVLGYAFGVESGASGNKGTLWVDDVALYTAELPEVAPTPKGAQAAPTATPVAPTDAPEPGATSTPQPPAEAPEVTATPAPSGPEAQPSGGLCRSAAMVLPACAIAIALRRRPKEKHR